ncbi:uncharacterized protein LOC117581608 [Drosophila guanche]|uniref:C-type lectin domain-containing protein n=1 Tax=Drosophila guanche TaxID=7266 RepID=A0A3B0K4U3_DROGU|nr:uncharacterized protein LOC117581608 [Drosophila guanche]SPP78488.1 Hypothetical predicted protein [Drosophila guanche]
MASMGKSFMFLTFVGLLVCTAVFQDYWQPRCTKPFVDVGGRCIFFSSNKAPTYEYYKVTYKSRVLSVPVLMGWLHANLGCEAIDDNSRLLTVRSEEEMRLIADYLKNKAHSATHTVFWCGGHRGRLSDPKDIDHETLHDFYWHNDAQPMNYSNFVKKEPPKRRFGDGYCVYMEFTGTQLVMGVDSCHKKWSFACELQTGAPKRPSPFETSKTNL